MQEIPLALLVGALAGFLGAIPPGPLNVTILRKTAQGHRREAFRVALGGAAVDTLVCALVGMGFGWILEKAVTNRWVKGALALFLLGYGMKILVLDRKRGAEADTPEAPSADPETPPPPPPGKQRRFRLPVLTGLLQGAANPTLIVNWTLFISFLVGHRLLRPTLVSAAGFAVGIGAGVFGWFTVLIELIEKLKDHTAAKRWLRRSATVAGALLVLFGLFFTWKTIRGA